MWHGYFLAFPIKYLTVYRYANQVFWLYAHRKNVQTPQCFEKRVAKE
jgi:hypothetical protein